MEYFVFHFEKFLLVFARIMGLFFTVSFFSSDALPETIRLGLIFLVTAAIYPLVSAFVPEPSPNMIEYGLSALGEGIIGMALGMIMSVYFTVCGVSQPAGPQHPRRLWLRSNPGEERVASCRLHCPEIQMWALVWVPSFLPGKEELAAA